MEGKGQIREEILVLPVWMLQRKTTTGFKHALVLSMHMEGWTCMLNGLLITYKLTKISSFVRIEGNQGH